MKILDNIKDSLKGRIKLDYMYLNGEYVVNITIKGSLNLIYINSDINELIINIVVDLTEYLDEYMELKSSSLSTFGIN